MIPDNFEYGKYEQYNIPIDEKVGVKDTSYAILKRTLQNIKVLFDEMSCLVLYI